MDDGRRDFDFFFGRWRTHNRRLARRLEGNTDWLVFEATIEARPILGGIGNVDTYSTARYHDGQPFEGFTLRVFEPTTRLWSIWWVDDRIRKLEVPVVGRFEGDRALFLADDVFAGRPIRVRFDWTRGETNARWEQAFSEDGGETWETNWVMEHTRIA